MTIKYSIPPELTPEEQAETLRKIKYRPIGPVIAKHFRDKGLIE
jgi:hypothetical protein